MRSRLPLILACIFLVSSLYADVKISYLSGSVAVLQGKRWVAASPNMVLGAKDRIKTLSLSKAMLTVDDTTRIWVGQNSEMEIAGLGQESLFSLLAGKVRAKVKLLSGRRFKVQTPVCVASVRGTEFVIASEGTLQVIEGLVEFGDILQAQLIGVGAGQMGNAGAGSGVTSREMTPEERTHLNQEWQGFGEGGQSNSNGASGGGQPAVQNDQKQMERFEELRQELHEVAQDVRNDISTTRELTNEIKESDISAGRTLRDVHGNLVRVEQHVLRPDASTIQILNLTKRDSYNYSRNLPSHWTYTGPTGSRLDVLDIRMTMNMPLPEQLTEWPAYISSKGDDMHPDKVNVSFTNQEDKIEMDGVWTPAGGKDTEGNTLSDDQLVFTEKINGWTVDTKYDPGNAADNLAEGGRIPYLKDGTNHDGSDTDDLWVYAVSPDIKLVKDGQVKFVNLYTEGYGIDNNGNILNLGRFTSSTDNPFTVLKQVAGEQIIFCRYADDGTLDGISYVQGDSFFKRGNLDLVYTPDIAIAIAEKLATQISDMNKSSSNSDSGSGSGDNNMNP